MSPTEFQAFSCTDEPLPTEEDGAADHRLCQMAGATAL